MSVCGDFVFQLVTLASLWFTFRQRISARIRAQRVVPNGE